MELIGKKRKIMRQFSRNLELDQSPIMTKLKNSEGKSSPQPKDISIDQDSSERLTETKEKQTEGERLPTKENEIMKKLIQRHGDDYRTMASDKILNPFKWSKKEIKRKFKTY